MASNHFKKSFSVKPCVWLRMKNRIFQICISVDRKKKPLTRKLFYISIFTSNHFRTELQTCKERERERERETVSKNRPSSSPMTIDRAPVRRPTLHRSRRLQHRANQAKINSNTTRSCLRRATSPSPPPHDLASRSNPVASLSSFFSQFDRI